MGDMLGEALVKEKRRETRLKVRVWSGVVRWCDAIVVVVRTEVAGEGRCLAARHAAGKELWCGEQGRVLA